MGLQKNLHMKGNQFSNANTFFYLATTLAEFPTGMWTIYKTRAQVGIVLTEGLNRLHPQQGLCEEVVVDQRDPLGYLHRLRSRIQGLPLPLGHSHSGRHL